MYRYSCRYTWPAIYICVILCYMQFIFTVLYSFSKLNKLQTNTMIDILFKNK